MALEPFSLVSDLNDRAWETRLPSPNYTVHTPHQAQKLFVACMCRITALTLTHGLARTSVYIQCTSMEQSRLGLAIAIKSFQLAIQV